MECHFFPEKKKIHFSCYISYDQARLWFCRKAEMLSYCWGIPRGCLGSLVVMENNHDQVPMSITNVPSNPWRGVCVDDQRY